MEVDQSEEGTPLHRWVRVATCSVQGSLLPLSLQECQAHASRCAGCSEGCVCEVGGNGKGGGRAVPGRAAEHKAAAAGNMDINHFANCAVAIRWWPETMARGTACVDENC